MWLGNIYRPLAACRLLRPVRADNHHGCRDPARCSRYTLGPGAAAPWRREVAAGRARLADWLRARRAGAADAAADAGPLAALARAPITLG